MTVAPLMAPMTAGAIGLAIVMEPALKFTVPVGRNCPPKLCAPPLKLIVPAPPRAGPLEGKLNGAPRFSVAPAATSIGRLLTPPALSSKVPSVKFTVPVLLKATPLKLVRVPAPLLLKVPALLKAWAPGVFQLKFPSPVTLNTPPARLLKVVSAASWANCRPAPG